MAVAVQRPPVSFARDAPALQLEDLVGEARDSFAAELAIPMTVAAPPILTSIGSDGRRERDTAAADRIGLSMSAQLFRRLGDPGAFGNVFPVARALDDLRGWCRGRHLSGSRGPWSDHAADLAIEAFVQRPLCARLAYQVVVWRVPLPWVAHQERQPMPVVRRLLLGALRHMWDQRREWAYADDSGVPQVLADQRRERREARQRAEQTASGQRCARCGGPYDPGSLLPCAGGLDGIDATDQVLAELGAVVLCAPARP